MGCTRQWYRLLTQPAINDIGIDPVGQRHAGNRCACVVAFGHDLAFEFWAVVTPLGTLGDRLARHGVHDLHSAHDACSMRLSQDGIASRIRCIALSKHSVFLALQTWKRRNPPHIAERGV